MGVLIPLLAGAIFAMGLGISDMVNPKRVQGFLDLFGEWDPSLIFVMVGAIALNFVLFKLILKRPKPLWEGQFHLPTKKDLDPKLILGSILFGIGWGLAGICPGPSLVMLPFGGMGMATFVGSMVVGMLIFHLYDRLTLKKS